MVSRRTLVRMLHGQRPFADLPIEVFLVVVELAVPLRWVTFISVCDFATTYRTSSCPGGALIHRDGIRVAYCDARVMLLDGSLRTLRTGVDTVVFSYGRGLPRWLFLLKDIRSCMVV